MENESFSPNSTTDEVTTETKQNVSNNRRTDILRFNNCSKVCQLKSFLQQSSILEVVGVDRKEIRHSRFLKWLFEDKSLNVESSDSPIMHLFDAYVKRCDQLFGSTPPKGIEEGILNDIETRSIIAKKIKVEIEYNTDNFKFEIEDKKTGEKVNKSGKIDILLRGELETKHKCLPFSIVIENKIDSDEHDDQTMKYFSYMTGEEIDKNINPKYKCPKQEKESLFFIYLTPSKENEMVKKPDISCDQFVHMSYQDILDHIIIPILHRNDLTEITRNNLWQYILSLCTVNNNGKDNKKATNVMAVSDEIQNLALDVWKEHNPLIKDSLEANRKKVWDEYYNTVLNAFWESNRVFLQTLLSIIAGYHKDEDVRKKVTKYYYQSLESKPKCFIDGILTKPMDIAKVACVFAEKYVKHYEKKNFKDPAVDLSKQILEDYKNVCGTTTPTLPINLFNPSIKNTLELKYNNQTVCFNKNCWATGKSGSQFDKLFQFINEQKLFVMTVEKA